MSSIPDHESHFKPWREECCGIFVKVTRSFTSSPTAAAWIFDYFAIIVPLCFWGAVANNRRAVRNNLDPRLAELEKLHADLFSNN